MQERVLVFAVQASTGTDLRRFPMELDGAPEFHLPAQDVHQKLAQPLLVDLHSDQSFVTDYLRRNGTSWEPVGRSTPSAGGRPHGGSGAGLHLVIPVGDEVFIIEGATGCTQKKSHIHCSTNRRCAWYGPVGFGRGDQRGKYHHARVQSSVSSTQHMDRWRRSPPRESWIQCFARDICP